MALTKSPFGPTFLIKKFTVLDKNIESHLFGFAFFKYYVFKNAEYVRFWNGWVGSFLKKCKFLTQIYIFITGVLSLQFLKYPDKIALMPKIRIQKPIRLLLLSFFILLFIYFYEHLLLVAAILPSFA